MWSLKSIKDSSSFNFLVDKEYVVGRKNADVMLLDDLSISRRHATLSVIHPIENLGDPAKISEFKVKDASSKYGTLKNGCRLEPEQEVLLQSGDTVKFGQFQSSFKVCYTPLVVTTSCVLPSLKNELKLVIRKLGGHLISEWRVSCTHLVMSGVKVTVKALCCLMSLRHIITPAYLENLLESIAEKKVLPNPANYLPPIDEPQVNKEEAMFTVVEARKNLFQDKRFIFLEDKQMKKLYIALSMGGANAMVLNENSALDINLITDQHSCVIQPMGGRTNDQKFTAFVTKVQSVLENKKKRMIPESDFGLAVVYSSTEKFCNPDFLAGNDSGSPSAPPRIPSQSYTQEVYVAETQEREQRHKRSSADILSSIRGMPSKRSRTDSAQQVIEESQDIPAARKRPLSSDSSASTSGESSNANQGSKRIKTEIVSILDTDSQWEQETQPNSVAEVPVKVECVPESVEVADSMPLTDFTLKTTDKSLRPLAPGAIVPKMSRSFSNISLGTTATNHRGNDFRSKPESDDADPSSIEEDLPRNLIKVAFVDLVKRHTPLMPVSSENCNSEVKNFKKFKKVIHAGACTLPKIIGGSDLVVQNEASSRAIDQWLQENAVGQVSESIEEAGEFDWDFPKRNTVRGR